MVSSTRGDQETTAVTYGGQPLTLAVSRDAGDNNAEWASIWYLVAPPVGTATVAVSYGKEEEPNCVAALSYFGVDQANPINATASNASTSSSSTVSVDITTTVDDAMIVGGLGHHGGDTDPHHPSDDVTNERYDVASGSDTTHDSGYAGGEILTATAGTYTFRWTNSTADDYAIACIALAPAAGGSVGDSHASGPDWWDVSWTDRKQLTFDNAGQSENLVDFPVLVKLDASRIDYGSTQNAGEDLRFVDADGTTVLDHEIEVWNESGTSYVWVEVPQIDGSSSSDFIWMYFGNASASDDQNADGTWNSGYEAVYHLHDDYQDSTSHNVHGTNQGADDTLGHIGDGADFIDNNTDYVDLGNPSNFDFGTGDFTISAWFQRGSGQEEGAQVIIGNGGEGSGGRRWALEVYDADEGGPYRLRIETDNGSTTYQTRSSTSLSSTGWYWGTAVRDGGTLRLYLDATQEDTDTCGTGYDLSGTSQRNAYIGAIRDHGNGNMENYYDDQIDEVRVESVARSADWITAQYLSMTDALITFSTGPGLESNDATAKGGMNAANLVTGQIAGALDFDGVDDFVDLGDALDMGTSDRTISVWVKTTDDGSVVAQSWTTPSHNLSLGSTTAGAAISNGSPISVASSTDPTDDVFHHLVSVWDRDGNLSLYVDGVLEDSTSIASLSAIDVSSGDRLGFAATVQSDGTAGDLLDGTLDEIRIADVARSADWIKAQYLSMTDAFIKWGSHRVVRWREVAPGS